MNAATKMCTSTVGMAHELVAAIDLTRRGYQVYRALASGAPFDLVAYKDGRCLRVEVTTALPNTRNLNYNNKKDGQLARHEVDLLIVVRNDLCNYIEGPHCPPIARRVWRVVRE